jgi:hypothetical protein
MEHSTVLFNETPPRNTNTAALGKGISLYRTGLYSFFHQFVNLVFHVGHPADAELYLG